MFEKPETEAQKHAFAQQWSALVWKLAWTCMRRRMAKFTTVEDLAQEGFYALFEAAERFNEDNGSTFMTYSYSFIYGRIRARMDDGGLIKVPGGTSRDMASQKKPNGRFLSETIAAAARASECSTFTCANCYGGKREELLIGDDRVEDTLESAHRREMIEMVREKLRFLDERERFVVLARQDRTCREIAVELGCSRQRIRQIEQKAMEKLRRKFGVEV